MPLFRLTLNNHYILSSEPFWQTQGKNINQIAWILPRTMNVSPFTLLDGPRRSKSWTVDFGSTTGACPKAVDLIHTYKYPSFLLPFLFPLSLPYKEFFHGKSWMPNSHNRLDVGKAVGHRQTKRLCEVRFALSMSRKWERFSYPCTMLGETRDLRFDISWVYKMCSPKDIQHFSFVIWK